MAEPWGACSTHGQTLPLWGHMLTRCGLPGVPGMAGGGLAAQHTQAPWLSSQLFFS